MEDVKEAEGYPAHLIKEVNTRNGEVIIIRPVKTSDTELIKAFSRQLSSLLKHLNYMEVFYELPQSVINCLTNVDYKKSMTFVAVHAYQDQELVVGIVHYNSDDGKNCEFDMVITDKWQNKGLGTKLSEEMINHARDNGIEEIRLILLSSNLGGIQLAKSLGFAIHDGDEATVKLVIKKL